MIKVGIIGCGKIADAHAEQIGRIPWARIVGVCDRELLMAKQLADRFPVDACFEDVDDLLRAASPDVVHITTPPQSHFSLGKTCIAAGAHVYIEKPFTVNAQEAVELIDIANQSDRKITVGHDYQFTHAKRMMRDLVSRDYLGGPPIHMESYHCYELGSESYARAVLGDRNHWVRSLPGTLMHNNISHGIGSIAEYLSADGLRVRAEGYRSALLAKIGETDIIDEARVVVTDADGRSAYFTFSTQIRPVLHQLRLYGEKNALIVDHDQQTCIRVSGRREKSYLEKFLPPLALAREYATNSVRNMSLFLRNDLHMKNGMKYLIEAFYRSILEHAELPIRYGEIITTAAIMDDIFAQVSARRTIPASRPETVACPQD